MSDNTSSSPTYNTQDIALSIIDCESLLRQTRSRLIELRPKLEDPSTPHSFEDDLIVRRRKVRMKGIVSGGRSSSRNPTSAFPTLDQAFISSPSSTSSISSPTNSNRTRRASLTTDMTERSKDSAIRAFNLNALKGLTLLREAGFSRTAEQTSRILLTTKGLNREQIGLALGSFTDERGVESLRLYCEGATLPPQSYVSSLRSFLSRFRLPGESQMVYRILEAFSIAYWKINGEMANNGVFESPAVIFGISYSVIILNTDLHSDGKKAMTKFKVMSKSEFVTNTRRMTDCSGLSQVFLEEVYDNVKSKEIAHQITKHDSHGTLFHDVVREGWLKKKSPTFPNNFQKRYFVLTREPPQLYYFEDDKRSDPLGMIPLLGVMCAKSEQHKKGLEIKMGDGSKIKSVKHEEKLGAKRELVQGGHKVFVLKSLQSTHECLEWIQSLESVIQKA